ncbi:glycosyltransferase involved in cell wall biosynthesis [Mesoflavibacter sabulilitoris]|uniref:Glycosyl transferase family 1 n=1 Tax=Mesoflavibacter zeaxanthinifaciens subsp. sabulilitoris TaxID=1520893 RepID=A0A2T1N7M8_9FLAO|nr:glycosyltransferase [Mesoflavibacter zeaxanthinifaciens]MBB3124032.1 glycosyltransferase involved in cell wall biosynthesis [Mesoflavibacter zeaxanthinifaciens subsp. sabulilitoris]PSG87793.1 glycosyl transferase family 1 [Mesoflavibacter zeaxanthinifaciens subsp. sabulilitoris]
MKLAIVTAYPPSKVTLNEYAYHLVKHFRQKDQVTEVVLLTDKTEGAKDIDFVKNGCRVSVKECWEFNSYKNLFTVNKALNQTKPDAVLFNLQFMKFGDKKVPAALGLMLPLVCRLKKIPNIVLLHNILEEVDLGKAGFTSNKLLQNVYNFIGTSLTKLILKADTVAVTMHKYVDVLNNKYKSTNVVQIPHGTFEVTEEQPEYTLPDGPLQIMTFGKFGTYKKVEAMIEAVVKVREKTGLDLEVVVAGTDNPNVPGYLEGVKQKYNHVPQVRYTGYVEEEEVPTLFKESAVVVFPYTSTTGSSGVLHQAGSYGKAVVMPDLGDLALLVQDEGYQGEFFEPTSIDSLANAIEAIVTNEDYRISLGKANYKAATAYPMQKIADMYLEQFDKLIKKKNPQTNTVINA